VSDEPEPEPGRAYPHDPKVRTVQLGQFSDEHGEQIAAELEKADITWWYKQPGMFSRIWEWGVRIYVDRERLDEAQAIARALLNPAETSGDSGS